MVAATFTEVIMMVATPNLHSNTSKTKTQQEYLYTVCPSTF